MGVKKELRALADKQRAIIKEMVKEVGELTDTLRKQSEHRRELADTLLETMLNYNLPESEVGSIMDKQRRLREHEKVHSGINPFV